MADSNKKKSLHQFSSDPGTYSLEPKDDEADSEQTTGESTSFWEHLFKKHRPLEKETAFFILVSALDVFMTYLVLRSGGAESNRVAKFFLDHWGMRGMVYFKFFMVAFTCVLTQVIATKKEQTARWILNFAIIVVGGVVIYSLTLLMQLQFRT